MRKVDTLEQKQLPSSWSPLTPVILVDQDQRERTCFEGTTYRYPILKTLILVVWIDYSYIYWCMQLFLCLHMSNICLALPIMINFDKKLWVDIVYPSGEEGVWNHVRKELESHPVLYGTTREWETLQLLQGAKREWEIIYLLYVVRRDAETIRHYIYHICRTMSGFLKYDCRTWRF